MKWWEALRAGRLDALLQPVPPQDPQLTSHDARLAGFAAAAAMLIAAWGFHQLGTALYTEGSFNIWFQADNPRVIANLFDPASNQFRASVHPAFAILTTPWMSWLPRLGIPPLVAGEAIVLAAAGLSVAAMFFGLRWLGLPALPAFLFTCLFIASASFVHWYSQIEIVPFAGLSVALVLLLLCRPPGRRRWWVLASALSLGMTITNWSAGLAAALVRWPLRQAAVISAAALAAIFALSILQHAIYPTAGLFFDRFNLESERHYMATGDSDWHPFDNLRVLLVYSMVAPRPVLETQDDSQVITNQHQSPLHAGVTGVTAMMGWLLLLVLGARGAVSPKVRPVAMGLGLMLLFQLALGAVYGNVSFLYAVNIAPMLVLLAAMSWFAPRPARLPALAIAGFVTLAGFVNNIGQFNHAAHLAQGIIAGGGNPPTKIYKDEPVLIKLPRH